MKRKANKELQCDGMIDVTKLTREQTKQLASIIFEAYQRWLAGELVLPDQIDCKVLRRKRSSSPLPRPSGSKKKKVKR